MLILSAGQHAFSGISPHFRPRRHLLSAADYRQVMTDR
jgi:putative transposase